MNTLITLLNSRKFYVGAFSVLGIAAATLLRALDKIPADALLPTIVGIAGLGTAFIAATGLEDAAKNLVLPEEATPETPSEPAKKDEAKLKEPE